MQVRSGHPQPYLWVLSLAGGFIDPNPLMAIFGAVPEYVKITDYACKSFVGGL